MHRVLLLILCALNMSNCTKSSSDAMESLFGIYMRKFQKEYQLYSAEYYKRLEIFRESVRRHKKLNIIHNVSSANQATFGFTMFSDLSQSEFADTYLKLKPSSAVTLLRHSQFKVPTNIPQKVDWREKGAITKVKDQKSCGACWAFSLVETVEAMQKIQGGPLEELSVQQVINCAKGESKCEGGDMRATADWLIQDQIHVTTEKAYPLKDVSGNCDINPSAGVEVESRVANTYYVDSEEDLLQILANQGPVAVAVDAKLWQDYIGGVIQNNCYTNINHAVQIVGYDLTGSVPFYIVRNSWGESFGDNGYLYIKIGGNLCGIAVEAVAVRVKE